VFHVKHEGWTPGSLPAEARARLDRYRDLLRDRAVPAGLIAQADASDLEDRHVLDSLRGAPLIPHSTQEAIDLGSGAGLPGIPLAVALPHVAFTLVDSRRRRVAFLELVVDDLRLGNVTVIEGRVEDLRSAFDVCLARGFAGPRPSWRAAERLLRSGGRLLYWAGGSFGPDDLPEDARLVGLGEPTLESGGPIVIMARQ
jgi:16S rRNA (guanine527-N7)-methyltransferase